jgi:hypothetical protein
LFISMRSGASVIQVRALKELPRGARMFLGFTGTSMRFLWERKRPDIQCEGS